MQRTSPVMVVILSVITCGFYLIAWYYDTYKDLEFLTGQTPTGNSFLADFFLTILTVGVWGVYVDLMISRQISSVQEQKGLTVSDTTALILILDIGSYVTGYFTGMISSAIHQSDLNRIFETS